MFQFRRKIRLTYRSADQRLEKTRERFRMLAKRKTGNGRPLPKNEIKRMVENDLRMMGLIAVVGLRRSELAALRAGD